MFDQKPSTWLAGIALTDADTKLSLPIATFPELTAAEANPTTGDIRKLVFALIEELYQRYAVDTVAADRPANMTITRYSSTNETTGRITRTYTFRMECEATGMEVAAEA